MKRYLIVGGSAAGMAAAEKICQLDEAPSVTVLSEEHDAPYFRPMIPFVISRKKNSDQISLAGQGPYRSKNIDLVLGTRAKAINSRDKTVTAEDGTSYSYDALLIATGSRPKIPESIKGTKTEGVFALRTLDDSRRAADRASTTDHAVMLGGGLLNLKAAFALLERNIQVTLVVYSPEILSQLMDPEDAFLIRKTLDDSGLKILTGTSAVEILADNSGVRGVLLDNGQVINCQMVCIGKGVQPNIEWLNGGSIDLQQGVVVDQHTQTSCEEVFAAGDVAVTFDPVNNEPVITGLWTNAVEMGKCAGANMAGRPTVYGGTFGILNATQVANMPFISMGNVHTAGTDYEIIRKSSPYSYRKLVFSQDGERLVGAVFVGDIRNGGLYRALIRDQTSVARLKPCLANNTLHYGHFLKLS